MTDAEKSLREQLSPSDEFEYDLETRALYRQLMASGDAHPITTMVSTPRKPEIVDAWIWVPLDPSPEGAVLELKVSKTRQLTIDDRGMVFDSVWKTPHDGLATPS